MTQIKINKTYLVILLGILAALSPFTIDMYLPAFGRIAEDFGTDEKHVAFTLTSYFAGIAAGQLLYGPIVDKYGRKKPLLTGLFIYSIAAFGCALSPDIWTMIGMRLLQALGGCVGMVASNAVISDVYEPNERAKVYSSIMLVMGVAPLIAPSVGSLFLAKADWNYIFYFLTFFSLFVIALIYFFLPETSRYMHNNRLRAKAIGRGYFEILENRSFLFYTLAGSLSMSILFAYVSSASFIFLTIYKLDKASFSILFAVNATGLIAGNYLNGILTRHFHYIRIANAASRALVAVTLAAVLLVYFYPGVGYQWLGAGIFSIMFLSGLINPNATAASLAPFTANAGGASALGGAMRMGTGALVAAAIGTLQGESAVTMFTVMLVLAVSASALLGAAPRQTSVKTAEEMEAV